MTKQLFEADHTTGSAKGFTRTGSSILCLVAGILLNLPVYGNSSPEWSWAFRFGGSGTDTGLAVKVDRDGNSYVTGAFSATAHFQTQPASASKSLTSEGGTDGFLAKYGPSRTLKWLIQIGGPGDDQGFDVGFDAARNIYVAGMFTDRATFRGINGSGRTVTGMGQTIFLAKYTPSGVLAWVQTGTGFNATNGGYGVAVEPLTGSVYVTGISQGETTFSSSNGAVHSVSGSSFWHMVLAKYDVAGNFQWGVTNAAAPNSLGHKVAVDADNNAYVTGWMEGATVFHSNDGHDQEVDGFSGPVQTFPDFPGDAFVVKYDEKGDLQWVNHIGGYKAIGTDVATSRDGRVSITGFIGNIANSQPSQSATIVTSQPGASNINLGGGQFTQPYNKDVFFATYDEDGVLLEAQRFGGTKDEGGSGIAYDRHGNLILAGIFQGTIAIEGSTLTGKDPYNLFVAKFSRNEVSCVAGFADHKLEWAAEADGPNVNFENNPRIGLTNQGDVMVTGTYQPAAKFGSVILKGAGLDDGFVAFLSALDGHGASVVEISDED
jgi:hypothetical protein